VSLVQLKETWLAALEDAAAFIRQCDPEEMGYSTAQNTFVQPHPGDDVTPHYGRPGGVLPIVR
jgi:hypothetical protein